MIESLLEYGLIFAVINCVMWIFGVDMRRVMTVYIYLTLIAGVFIVIGVLIGLGIKTVTCL
jgi:hypothetical protein